MNVASKNVPSRAWSAHSLPGGFFRVPIKSKLDPIREKELGHLFDHEPALGQPAQMRVIFSTRGITAEEVGLLAGAATIKTCGAETLSN